MTSLISATSQEPDGFTGCTAWRVAQDGAGRQAAVVINYAVNPAEANLLYWDTDGTLMLELTYTDSTSTPPYAPGFDTFNFGNQPTVTGGTLQCVVGPQVQIN